MISTAETRGLISAFVFEREMMDFQGKYGKSRRKGNKEFSVSKASPPARAGGCTEGTQ